MRSVLGFIAAITLIAALVGCHSGQQGVILGTVSPMNAGVRVAISKGGQMIVSVTPDAQTGTFAISVTPGTYDVAVTSPSSPFPLSFTGIVVNPGGSAALGTIQIATIPGTGTISGWIRGGKAVRVSLLMDGRERASVATDPSGKYVLKELPGGNYTLQVQAPDYAGDVRTVVLGDGQQAAVNIRLLYMTALDGVDWARGTIRVRGVGLPPPQAPTPTVRREMAKRAALADAERNLLRVIDMIETGPGEKLSSFLGRSAFTQVIEGYIKGYRIAAERDLDGGRIEVEIELPLTGPGGLSSRIPAEEPS